MFATFIVNLMYAAMNMFVIVEKNSGLNVN